MNKYRVVHTTKYNFKHTVHYCEGQVRLTPQAFNTQKLAFSQLVFRPLASKEWQQPDDYGNVISYFEMTRSLMSLSISAVNTVTVLPVMESCPEDSVPCDDLTRQYAELPADMATEIQQYLEASPLIQIRPEFAEYAQRYFVPGLPLLLAVKEFTRRLHHDFIYECNTSHVETTAWQAMQLRRGVCQDYAQVAIACLRSIGIAARYVTGYVSRASQHERHIGSALSHAWFSIFEPNVGWVDFDPTNNCRIDECYITVGWGRDYSDVTPISGTIAAANQHSMNVSIDIETLSQTKSND